MEMGAFFLRESALREPRRVKNGGAYSLGPRPLRVARQPSHFPLERKAVTRLLVDDDGDQHSAENKLVLFRARPLEAWETRTLLSLSRDPHERVRDCATFALAARDDDDPVIRQALIDRIDDADFDTRCEALWGLARRQDERALRPLLNALKGDVVGELLVEAAGFLARPVLVDALQALQPWWDADPELLADALARCRGESAGSDRRWNLLPANDNRA